MPVDVLVTLPVVLTIFISSEDSLRAGINEPLKVRNGRDHTINDPIRQFSQFGTAIPVENS